jgi:hypothetical protein
MRDREYKIYSITYILFFLTIAVMFLAYLSTKGNVALLSYVFPVRALSFSMLIFACFGYITAYSYFSLKKISIRSIVAPALVVLMLSVVVLPTISIDAYTYFYRSRILVLFNANPYIYSYDDFRFDKYYELLKNTWSSHTAVYGPFFWTFSSFLTFIAKTRLFISMYLMKFVFGIFYLVSSFILHLYTKSKKALYLYLWNPAIVFFGVLDSHSDMFIVFLIYLSLYFVNKAKDNKQLYLSWLCFLLVFYMKFYTVPLGLFIVYEILSKKKEAKEKIGLFFKLVFQAVVVGALLYIPYWGGVGIFTRLLEVYSTYERSNFFLGSSLFPIWTDKKVLYYFSNYISMFLKLSFICHFSIMLYKVLMSVTKGRKLANLKANMALSYTLFTLAFLRVWQPWYWLTPISLLILATKKNSINPYKGYIFALTFVSCLYIILQS